LFFAQVYSTVLATAVQTGGTYTRLLLELPGVYANASPIVLRRMFSNIKDLCDPHNTQRFSCAGSKVVYNASIIWGTIGPQRMFQHGQAYNVLMYFLILGVRGSHQVQDDCQPADYSH
jgi:hypothetical protein